MLSYHLVIFLLINLFINLSKQDYAAPVYTPVQDSIKNHQMVDQSDKAKISNDNLDAAGIVAPSTVADPLANKTTSQTQKSNQNIKRKRKYQNNKQYRPNERKNSVDDSSKINQFDLNVLLQLLNRQPQNLPNQDSLDRYNSILSTLNPTTNDLPIQLVPIYTTEPSVSNLLNNNNEAFQLYLRKLIASQQNKQNLESRSIDKVITEKPRITKRVYNSNALSNQSNLQSSSSNLQLLNQLLQNQQQPMYTLIQPQQSASSPFYVSLQPSFPTSIQSTSNKNSQPQVNSLIETGDKIIAKFKQWRTDILNPKSSLNRQINEVINVASNAALLAVFGGLVTFGLSSLIAPLQLNKKFERKSVLQNKQKTVKSEEKKDKNDEKTAKSDQTSHQTQPQKNTKSLDKKSRLVSLMERAGDEFNHFKNLVEIARNFEEVFKKYNVQDRECKYRILCEISSTNQSNETSIEIDQYEGINNNLLKRRSEVNKRKKRQIRLATINNLSLNDSKGNSSRMLPRNDPISTNKTIECVNCSKLNLISNVSNTNDNINGNTNSNTNNFGTYKEPTNFLLTQSFKLIERLFYNNRGSNSLKNLIRNFNLDKFINENKEGFINFMTTIDHLMNRAQKSGFFTYLLNDEQSFRTENKLFKVISEQSNQLKDKIKDFLDNLTIFQQVVTKEAKNSELKSIYQNRMLNFYNLRSKRTINDSSIRDDKESSINEFFQEEEQNIDVGGLRFILNDLIKQLKIEQQQDNFLLPLSKIFLNSYQQAFDYGTRHSQNQCKARYLKCKTNYIGLNNKLNNNEFKRKMDLEILSNSHYRNSLKPKPAI